MDVEVTVAAPKARFTHWRYRLIEAFGLIAFLYGVASGTWSFAIPGAVTIFVTYAIFRNRHDARRHGKSDGNSTGGYSDEYGESGDGGSGD